MIFTISIIAALMCFVVLAARRLGNKRNDLPLTAEWIDNLSTDKYRSMLRLLNRADLERIRSTPGCTPEMAVQFRKKRVREFNANLESLSADFNRICTAIRVLMLHSRRDRPDLAVTLLRSEILFAMAMVSLKTRVFLYGWGWCDGDATEVFRIFESMRAELQSFIPAHVGAAA